MREHSMTKTFCLLATAVLAFAISAPSGLAQSNLVTATYDATVQQFQCNSGLGDSSAEWYSVEPKRSPGEDLGVHGIINGQNLNNNLFRSRLTNPKKVWFLRTTVSGTVGSDFDRTIRQI